MKKISMIVGSIAVVGILTQVTEVAKPLIQSCLNPVTTLQPSSSTKPRERMYLSRLLCRAKPSRPSLTGRPVLFSTACALFSATC